MRGDNDSRLPLEVTRSAATPVACGGPLIPPTCGADRLGGQGERLMPGCCGEHHRGTGGLDGDLADPEARRLASGWPVFIRPQPARNNLATPAPLSARSAPGQRSSLAALGLSALVPRMTITDAKAHEPRSAEGFPNVLRHYARDALMFAVSVAAHATGASEGDRHRGPRGGTRGIHTLEQAERPWPGPAAARCSGGHLTADGGGHPQHLNPSRHGGDTATDGSRR